MLFSALTQLLSQAWGLLQSGWAWALRGLRAVAEEVAAFFARIEEARFGTTRRDVAASPDTVPVQTEAHDQTPQAAPPRPSAPVLPSTVQAPFRKNGMGKQSTSAFSLASASTALATEAMTQRSAPRAASAPLVHTEPATANDRSDETALARMLASDDSPREVAFVRAWIAVQHQRARKVGMFEFLTRGLGYGPRNRKAPSKLNLYASTAEQPSDSDRVIACTLLTGMVAPSAVIRTHKPGQLVERGKDLTDAQILRRQADIKEGIYGRIQGTAWLLLSPDAPAIGVKNGQSATDALDAVPIVSVMDASEQARTAAA